MVAVPSPIIWVVGAAAATNQVMDDGPETTLRDAFEKVFAELKFPVLFVCLISIAASVYCYRRHRRFEDRGAAAWAAFVLITGVPGLFGYLLHRRWPVLERCSHCGKLNPVDRPSCRNCDAPISLPPRKDIEIFVEAA